MIEQIDGHVPVLYREVLEHLSLDQDGTPQPRIVVDCTLGLGGHAIGIIRSLRCDDRFIGIEWDAANLEEARNRIDAVLDSLSPANRPRVDLVHDSYAHVQSICTKLGVIPTHALYDLGISSRHADDGDRGFTWRFPGPLDMRYDRTGRLPTAKEWLSTVDIERFTSILREYGEEPHAYGMAKHLLAEHANTPFETTADLAASVSRRSRDRKSILRVFQAVRIAVNGEFDSMRTSIPEILGRLPVGGRISVISFHSVEDRIVKHLFAEVTADEIDNLTGRTSKEAPYRKTTRKPVVPTDAEITENPRARSAKLRTLVRIN
ncbi:MAG TPA: 16S rRNA (cytosine(1402)-N(4))-methyltransferase RsmH [bacterium]|nr:16S rRNA (cytosine(1402)-N(4))-methyltransferase RsmH [bacterium]